jgi:delta1-piperideine-2-carboxylate reductase
MERWFVSMETNGFAPLALERGIPILSVAAHKMGVAVMAIKNTYHFAAL